MLTNHPSRSISLSFVCRWSLLALILCSFASYAHSQSKKLDLRLCEELERTLKGTYINDTIPEGVCNLLALRDLAVRAREDVRGCDTVELLDQNVNDACKLVAIPDFDQCTNYLRNYCVNRHTKRQELVNACRAIRDM